MSDITRYRGDTRRIQRTVTLDGAAVNITDWSFVLTINREYEPDDTDAQVAQIVGVIADAAAGVVEFTPTLTDVATAGSYYYDIEAVDAGGSVSTLDKGAFTLLQDITKSNPSQTWVPEGELGESLILDGSDFWMLATSSSVAGNDFVIADRGGVTVASLVGTQYTYDLFMWAAGEQAQLPVIGRGIYEIEVQAYLSGPPWFQLIVGDDSTSFNNFVYVAISGNSSLWFSASFQHRANTDSNFSMSTISGGSLPGRVVVALRLDLLTYNYKSKAYMYGTADPGWQTNWTRSLDKKAIHIPSAPMLILTRDGSANVLELISYTITRVG
jgi:hypothetical protein